MLQLDRAPEVGDVVQYQELWLEVTSVAHQTVAECAVWRG
jgi:hypothetical protein